MKRIVGALIVVALVFGGWRIVSLRMRTAQEAAPAKKQPVVAVVPVGTGTIMDVIGATGTVEAETIVNIMPKVEQRIVWAPLREGDRVQAGQPVARLDAVEVRRQIGQAVAEQNVAAAALRDLLAGSRKEEVSQARAMLEQAQATSAKAEAALRNLRVLYAESGIPRQMMDDAEGKVSVNEAQVRAAEVQVADAEVEAERVSHVVAIGGVAKQEADRAQTRLATARAQLQSARAALSASKAALAHVRDLYGGPIPRREIEESEGRVREAKAGVQAAEQKLALLVTGPTPTQVALAKERVAQAAAKVAFARTQLEYCTIVSPVSGVVVKRNAEVGDMATPRSALLSVAATDSCVVRTAISEVDSAKLRPGMPAQVIVDGWDDKPRRLPIRRIYPSADAASRLIPVEIGLPITAHPPALGSVARVSFVLAVHEKAVMIPSSAVVQRAGGKRMAFVVRSDSTAEERELTIGIQSNDKLEVLAGLEPGEKLVVRGQEMLKGGVEVKVMQPKSGKGNKGADGAGKGPSRR